MKKLLLTTALIACCFISIIIGQSSFNPDSLKAIVESNPTTHTKLEALTGLTLGYLSLELYDSSILYCNNAIGIALSTGDFGKVAELNIMKGKALFYSQGPKQGIVPYKESYKQFAKIGDSAGMASALNGIGVMYQKIGQNDSALNCYIQLVTIAEKMGYEKILGMGYVNMGILYQYKRDFEKANYYINLSIPLNSKYRMDLVALAFMNQGLIHENKIENDSALIKYRRALVIYNEFGNNKMLADLYNNFGNVYVALQNLDSATYYYIKSKDIYEHLGDWYTFSQVYHNLAMVDYYCGNYYEALAMLDSCLVIANESSNKELESKAFLGKYLVYNEMGNYQQALESYVHYDSLNQNIYNIKKDELIAEMEMKYQNEKKQAQILLLERDNLKKAKQSNIYLFSGIGIIILFTFALLYFRQRTVKDRIIARQQIKQLEEEKKLLSARFLVEGQEEERKRIAKELHDGLGVLLSAAKMQFSTIKNKNLENRPLIEKATNLLEQAAGDVRKISHNMMPGLLTKLGLYEAIADLFTKLSESNGLEVHTDIPEELKRLSENKEIMLYRIMQELVNNTLKHAEAKNINISMKMIKDQLEIIYSDDGKGFNFEDKLDSKSIGLISIRSRIDFLNGKMVVFSKPGKGTSFQFFIPC